MVSTLHRESTKQQSSAAQKTILITLLSKDTILAFFTTYDFQPGWCTDSWLLLYAILLSTFWHLPFYFTVMKSSVLFSWTQQKLPHMPNEPHVQFPWLIPTILTVSCCFLLLLHLAPSLFSESYILFVFNIHSDFQVQTPHM